MTVTYLTGTRNPGAALLRFLPDYIEMLLERGETLITTNKRGVDEAVIRHCEQRKLPLQVCEFLADQRRNANRRIKDSLKHVEVQRIYSPTWLRFRHMAQQVEKMVFLHAHKTAGKCYGLSTTNAVKLACEKYHLQAEQLIIQQQHRAWIAVTELRQSPTVGAAHIYIYARQVPGLDGTRHCTAHFRIESWRQVGEVIQPGIGRREFILPNVSREEASLQMLYQSLLELRHTQPQRLIIHHAIKILPGIFLTDTSGIHAEVAAILKSYQQVIWQQELQSDLLIQIGASISKGQQLWNHTKVAATYRGLYLGRLHQKRGRGKRKEAPMSEETPLSLIASFQHLPDPRVEGRCTHQLIDIIVVAVCAVIAGAETWVDVENFGKAKAGWLKGFLELPCGIPSHDTFGRFFALLDGVAFQRCFMRWVEDVFRVTKGQVVALDGQGWLG